MSFPPTDIFSAVGLLVLNFGAMEYLTFDFLERELPADEFTKIKKQHFNDRLDRCFELLAVRGNRATPEALEEIRSCLKPVRELRNHVVHGYLLAKFDPNSHELVLTLSNPRELDAAYSKESRHIPLREIVRLHKELAEVHRQFEELLGYKHTTYSAGDGSSIQMSNPAT